MWLTLEVIERVRADHRKWTEDHGRRRALRNSNLAVCVSMFAATVTTAPARGADDMDAALAEAYAPFADPYEQIRARHPDVPELDAFAHRLKLLGEVARKIAGGVKALTVAAPNGENGQAGDSRTPQPPVTMALEVLLDYQPRFTKGAPLPAMGQDDLKTLRHLYDAAVKAASAHIAQLSAKAPLADEHTRSQVAQLCCVLVLLHTPDTSWSDRQTRGLPVWVLRAAVRPFVESLALRLRRPHTAFAIHRFDQSVEPGDSDDRTRLFAYLQTSAHALLDTNEPHAAIHCFQQAIQTAGPNDEVKSLYLRLAEVYARAGHPELAAEQLGQALALDAPDPSHGRAVMLHMRYLYEAQRYETVAAEAMRHHTDPRCGRYLPQIQYMAWLAHRRLEDREASDRWKREFLKAFPKHELAADIYFASAMAALIAHDHDEALRLFEIVEFRFPDSRFVARVKQICERLQRPDDAP